jgi:uncharacterized protein (TIGR00730 family)
MIKKVCVFCSSSDRVDVSYKQAAILTGTLLAKNGFILIFGGGATGLMGATSKAAIKNGGEVYGFMPEFLRALEGTTLDNGQLEIVETMHIRKQKMYDHSDAFVVLPGGFGTLDELFETLVWRQLALHHKPIIIVNTQSYWDPLKKLFENVIDNNFALPTYRSYLIFVDTPEEAIERLKGL